MKMRLNKWALNRREFLGFCTCQTSAEKPEPTFLLHSAKLLTHHQSPPTTQTNKPYALNLTHRCHYRPQWLHLLFSSSSFF